MTTMTISRRGFLQGAGALIVTFGLPIELRAQLATPLEKRALYSSVDSWLALGQDSGVTLFTGKVELGTGGRECIVPCRRTHCSNLVIWQVMGA